MQHTVAKRFIYCKHNITLWNTQVIPQKVVTFLQKAKVGHTLLSSFGIGIVGQGELHRISPDFIGLQKA